MCAVDCGKKSENRWWQTAAAVMSESRQSRKSRSNWQAFDFFPLFAALACRHVYVCQMTCFLKSRRRLYFSLQVTFRQDCVWAGVEVMDAGRLKPDGFLVVMASNVRLAWERSALLHRRRFSRCVWLVAMELAKRPSWCCPSNWKTPNRPLSPPPLDTAQLWQLVLVNWEVQGKMYDLEILKSNSHWLQARLCSRGENRWQHLRLGTAIFILISSVNLCIDRCSCFSLARVVSG